jgi:hypothetical protein
MISRADMRPSAKSNANTTGDGNRDEAVNVAIRCRPLLPGNKTFHYPGSKIPAREIKRLLFSIEKKTFGCTPSDTADRHNLIHDIGLILESEKSADHRKIDGTWHCTDKTLE